MKKILLTLFAALAVYNAAAAERSTEELRNIARGLLCNASNSKGVTRLPETVKQTYSTEEIVVFSAEHGACAFLARDTRYAPVLGYTDKSFNINAIHPAMRWWLENTTTAMRNTQTATKLLAVPDDMPEQVESFVTTQWSQGEPYNLLCPTYTTAGTTRNYPSGCLATAMAQIMNYYEYPACGSGKCTYQFNPGNGSLSIISLQLEEYPFRWEYMLDNYYSGQYSETEGEAVANLMRICGAAVEMEYTASGSGAMMYNAGKALRRNFQYDRGLPYFDTRFNTAHENSINIYNALARRIPILFGGVSTDGGHAFVLDGYDSSGLIHVNWGWGAAGGNGYFDLSYMNGYKDQQQYMPVTNNGIWAEQTSLFALYDGGMTLDKVSDTHIAIRTTRPLNIDCETYSGNLYFIARDLTTATDYILATQTLTSAVQTYYFAMQSGVSKPYVTIKNKITDGTYRVFMASKGDDETRYSPVRTTAEHCNSYILHVENGVITSLTPESDNAWMTTTGLSSAAIVQHGTDNAIFSVTGQRVDSSYHGIVIKNGRKYIAK